ncbi:MAG: bifunctional (p)ppGpp synthetase/guanosine-3',5'-bis(diphosphate) 3'-pyrophosphohydrolase [Magnetococcales bacterium]|nr:bifunctional (p)ppGpp synthetase/guanosine-3',5'-bis(diphosphate) 3'-pyrophosphohydrolase [Magnetococcales bacterium]
MKQWTELVKKILEYHSDADQEFLERLHQFIAAIPQNNKNQQDHFSHSLAVARTLVELRMDTASISAALLSGAVESGHVSLQTVREKFGEDVAFLTEGLTKILQLSPRTRSEIQAEEFRKMILAMAKDIRVILIRLAFCLQQMRLAITQNLDVADKLIQEVEETYAPIAHRLGIYWIKNELEDMAFRLKDPVAYATLGEEVRRRRKGGEDVVRKVVSILKKNCRKHHIAAEVFGREKHLHSIYAKLERKKISLEHLYDLIAYRIIVRKKADCYKVFGMIHGEFSPVPGRFKDYIAMPKSNGYKSLHTVVIGPFGNQIEIQIRTEKMHQIAESGVAAHWTYKEKGLDTKKHSAATGYSWLKRMLEVHQKTDDPGQFLEHVKIDLFPNEIYLFTPNGDIITLPQGATPVDFAYAVHSAVGDHCQGAKVNGRMVPLKTPLETGDSVEIITAKNQHPNPAWLRFVVTGQAKYRINRWEKARRREQGIVLGRELLVREIQKVGQGLALSSKAIVRGATHLHIDGEEELLYQVGISAIGPIQALHAMFPETIKENKEKKSLREKRVEVEREVVQARAKNSIEGSGKSMRLLGILPEMAVSAARCCSPVPGDTIVGIISTGKGIVIHGVECPNLAAMTNQPERWIEDIDWPEYTSQSYVTSLRIMAQNQRDTLPLVSQTVTMAKGNIVQIKVQDRDRDPFVLVMDVEVEGLELLEEIIRQVDALNVVQEVDRLRG